MKRKKWDEEMIKREVLSVVKALNLDRMPTRKEAELVVGDSSLTNKISKTGGFKMWSEKLGLELKESETKFGNEYEFVVKEILEELGYDVEKMTTKHPYDLLVNDNIKIDVKTSRFYENKDGARYHSFNLDKKHHNCDIFICICLDCDEEIKKCLIIPSKYLMRRKQLSVGINSIYDRFDKEFKYIDMYNIFYNTL